MFSILNAEIGWWLVGGHVSATLPTYSGMVIRNCYDTKDVSVRRFRNVFCSQSKIASQKSVQIPRTKDIALPGITGAVLVSSSRSPNSFATVY